ncbi:RNA polymerase sigma factor [Hirschia litorea]|uniref:RNA polymerase sigma factor n=1 Tax=Hirschia litorea TaxID=1199156 RepID=A0ABW2IQB5_9PROT
MSRIFEAFVENENAIRRVVARYCARPEDVDELVQETFLKCFAAELKAEIQEPKHFLLRAAKNTALSEIKKKRNTTTDYLEDSADKDVLVDEGQFSPETRYDGRRKLAVLAMAIGSLSADDQRMLLMRKMEHLKFKQIALRMDVSVSTVQKRVAAALLHCNAFFRSRGYDPIEFGGHSLTPKSSNIAGWPQKSTRRELDND